MRPGISSTLLKPGARAFTRVELAIVVAALVIAILFIVPIMRRRAAEKAMKLCQENLTRIDGAKEQLALDSSRPPEISVEVSDLVNGEVGFLREMPVCPNGHAYLINDIGVDPVCTGGEPGHSLSEVGSAITTEE